MEHARDMFRHAIEIDPNDSVVLYNVACNYASLGHTEKALNYLEQAIEHGTVSASWMKNDEDLASLHNSPRYQQMLERLESKSPPPET